MQIQNFKSQLIWRSQLIWIYTVCKGRVYPGSAGQELTQVWLYNSKCTMEFIVHYWSHSLPYMYLGYATKLVLKLKNLGLEVQYQINKMRLIPSPFFCLSLNVVPWEQIHSFRFPCPYAWKEVTTQPGDFSVKKSVGENVNNTKCLNVLGLFV